MWHTKGKKARPSEKRGIFVNLYLYCKRLLVSRYRAKSVRYPRFVIEAPRHTSSLLSRNPLTVAAFSMGCGRRASEHHALSMPVIEAT